MEQYNLDKGKNTGKSKRIKCLICGAVFDASLDKCPVCGAGPENFIPYEEEESAFRKDTDETFLILGNGAAGISAAEAIRERNGTCAITMISDEPFRSYNRPMLTKSLHTLRSAEEIAVHEPEWYGKNNIINQLGIRVEKIEPADKRVILNDGSRINYDKCIYALGAESFIPPFEGRGKPGVVSIRRFSDVEKIRELMPGVKNTVVIGGGVLGLEAAWELSGQSEVTVLEAADKLMVRQLDDAAGELIGEIIKRAGIDFKVNADIAEISGEGSLSGVKLNDGTFYPADLVIVSCGVRSNLRIAKEAGILSERGVAVNEKMETSAAGIYACGDCAEYKGINYALWSQAVEMGRIAGANAAGDSLVYEIVPAALTFQGMNTTLFAAGDNGRNPGLRYKSKEARDIAGGIYKKYYFVDDRLAGVILIGDTSGLAELSEALEEKRTYGELHI